MSSIAQCTSQRSVFTRTCWQLSCLQDLTLLSHNGNQLFAMQWNTWSKDTHHDHRASDYNKDEVAAGVQNFLICIEMFFAALAHAYAFPPKDYMDPSWNPSRGLAYSLRVMFDVRDVVDDVEGVVNDTVRSNAVAMTTCLLICTCCLQG